MTTSALPDWIPVALLVTATIGVPLGIYLFYRGFAVLARKRLIQNIPRSTIRSAAIGELEVMGKAVGPYTILSPLSQTECYYYRVEAHLTNEPGEGPSSRHCVESLSVPFFLEDGTGRVMVDARGAEVDLPCTYNEVISSSSEGDCVRHFLERRNLSASDLRLVEYCIAGGDPLFILGTLSENSTVQNGALAVANEPGFLSREAAELQRLEVLEYMHVPVPANYRIEFPVCSESREFDLSPPAVLRRKGSAPFVISQRSQRELVQQMSWRSLLYIWGGPVLALASVAYLMAKFA